MRALLYINYERRELRRVYLQITNTYLVAIFTSIWHLAGGIDMNISLSIGPVVSLIAGILILIMPRLLNIIVAVYLILMGLIGLFGTGSFHIH
jgi:hypothetical protein